MCLQIAVGETEKAIDAAWFWIEKNMMPELETIDHPLEKERWVSEKINMIVTEIGKRDDVRHCTKHAAYGLYYQKNLAQMSCHPTRM